MKSRIAGIVLLGLYVSCKEEEGANAPDTGSPIVDAGALPDVARDAIDAMDADASRDATPDAPVVCCPTSGPRDPFSPGGTAFSDGGCPQIPLEAHASPGLVCTPVTSSGTDENGCATVNYYLSCVPGADASAPDAG